MVHWPKNSEMSVFGTGTATGVSVLHDEKAVRISATAKIQVIFFIIIEF
jgi:hypothetical protein